MRLIPGYRCWMGNAGDLRQPHALYELDIEAVFELADNEPLAELSRELLRFRIPLSDGGENPEWRITLAIDSLATVLRQRIPTLIACSAGMSRSVCLAAAGLAIVETQPFERILERISPTGPIDVSPRLFHQFRQVLQGRPAPV